MRFSAKEQYALKVMVELAHRYGQGPISLRQVAQAQELSRPYLEQVVVPLCRAGLLRSRRGAYGGYFLAREPEAVTVGDVIRALEGSVVSFKCVVGEESCEPCEREGRCPTHIVWQMVREKLAETLDATTLADLVKED